MDIKLRPAMPIQIKERQLARIHTIFTNNRLSITLCFYRGPLTGIYPRTLATTDLNILSLGTDWNRRVNVLPGMKPI